SVAGKCPQYRGFQSPCGNAARAAFCANAYGNVGYSSQSSLGRTHVGVAPRRGKRSRASTARIDAQLRSREQHSSHTSSWGWGHQETLRATWQPAPSFSPPPRQAAKAPAETLAYVAAFDPARKTPDAIAVVDVDPASSSYGKIVNTVAGTNAGDEFHHFGWNACSSCVCPNAPHR